MADDFSQGFAALSQGMDEAQAKRQTALKGARQQVESALDQPTPPIPEDKPLPEAPQPNFGKDSMQWLAISAVMAGITGALTRRHATNALSAFAGAINGFRQGKMDVFDQQYKTWQAENQKMLEESRQLWQRRNAILQDRKLNIDEKMARLQMIDAETGDQVGYQTAQMKNFTLYTHNQDLLQQKILQMEIATERLQNSKDAKDAESINKTGLTLSELTDAQKRIMAEVKRTSPPGEGTEAFMARYQKAWQAAKIGVAGQSVSEVGDLIGQGKMAPLSAFALRSQWGQAVMAYVKENYPNYTGTEYAASQRTEIGFAQGKQGDQVRAINVAIDHLATADQLVDALQNGETQRINQLGNRIAVEFGSAAPTNLQEAAHIIGQEMVKAVVSAGGGVTERTAAADAFSVARSPEQLHGAIQTVRRLMAGQLQGLERQYRAGTGGRRDFDEELRLSPQAREALKGLSSGEQAESGAAGKFVEGQVYKDAQGNKAKYQNGQWVPQ